MKQRGELERLAGAAVIVTGSAAILDLRQHQQSRDRQRQLAQRPRRLGSEPYSSAKAGIGALTINLQGGLSPAGTLTGRRSGR